MCSEEHVKEKSCSPHVHGVFLASEGDGCRKMFNKKFVFEDCRCAIKSDGTLMLSSVLYFNFSVRNGTG